MVPLRSKAGRKVDSSLVTRPVQGWAAWNLHTESFGEDVLPKKLAEMFLWIIVEPQAKGKIGHTGLNST